MYKYNKVKHRISLRHFVKIYVSALILIFSSSDLNSQKPFDSQINVPANLPDQVKQSLEDIRVWLEKSTNLKFSINNGAANYNKGIQLVWLDSVRAEYDNEELLRNNGQSFYLVLNKTQNAIIVGSSTNSFINGIYTLMHELGFRWYMPGDIWAKIPDLKTFNRTINKSYDPSFQNRSYFGTGGIGGVPGLDDKNTFKKDFDDWNRRNRLNNTEFHGKGHLGQIFYRDNKAILDKNPSFFCQNKVNNVGRIDISNKQAVELFVNWAKQKVNYQDKFPMAGVDPADGSGGKDDCLPTNMKGINNWSDKYFWLANQVALELQKDKKPAQVQIYAYASHAQPPNFEIESNVYPIIIPYAFQRHAEPEVFIAEWKEKLKGRPMGIYDYWNITQWSVGIPQFDIYSIEPKLKLWHKSNINYVRVESTNAKGPMGHAWWIAAQMMWDIDQPFEKLYDEFLNNNFGEAADDIRNMYDRWSKNYQRDMEVSLSSNDLQKAESKVEDAQIKGRLNELKAYILYLDKYYKYNSLPNDTNYEDLIKYVNGIHHLRLLQTRAIQTLYIKPPAQFKSRRAKTALSENHTTVSSLTQNQINELFKKMIKKNPMLYALSELRFDFKKASVSNPNKKLQYNPLYINGTNNYNFYLPTSRKLSFQVGATAQMRFSIKDENGKLWFAGKVEGTKSGYERMDITLPKGLYVLQIGELYMFSRFIFPADIPLFTPDTYYDNYKYPLQYVYIPKGVTEIVYYDELGPEKRSGGVWFNPVGQKVASTLVRGKVYKVKVNSEAAGKVWTFKIANRNYSLLNIPNLFSVNNYSYQE